MKFYLLFPTLSLILNLYLGISNQASPLTPIEAAACGEWERFEGACWTILDKENLYTFVEAEQLCHQNNARLIAIFSREEQSFINDLIHRTQPKANVWFDAKYETTAFNMAGINMKDTFTNWQVDHPKKENKAGYCVQISVDLKNLGKWIEEKCEKKAQVLCAKEMEWAALEQLQKNILPPGFIYVQLPKEKEPQQIWPLAKWEDISEEYGDLFFRVSGSKSANFGMIQEESSPRLVGVKQFDGFDKVDNLTILPGEWSKHIRTGEDNDSASKSSSLSFQVSKEEVRPRNMAIKIWKRTA